MALDEATQAVSTWLDTITKAMPDDGVLTDAILREVGGLPVLVEEVSDEELAAEGMSASEIVMERRLNAAGAVAGAKAFAASRLEAQIDEAWAKAYKHEKKNPAKAKNFEVRANYLEQVRNYVDGVD